MPFATRFLYIALAGIGVAAAALAQVQSGRRTSPVAKLFVAEAKGETLFTSGDKVHEGRQAAAFDAPGTVIETKPDSHSAVVYSNGTGMFVDSDTRVQIARFTQEPFVPSQYTLEIEPSITHSDFFVVRGFIGICTNQMVSGSSMTYATAHAVVTVRGRKIAIRTSPDETVVYLLEGDVTVRPIPHDAPGHVLRPGEQAVVRPGGRGEPPSVTVGPIPSDLMQFLDDRVNVACNSRRTVFFETVDDPGDDGAEIVARPAVPAQVPAHLVVSPDRLPGTD